MKPADKLLALEAELVPRTRSNRQRRWGWGGIHCFRPLSPRAGAASLFSTASDECVTHPTLYEENGPTGSRDVFERSSLGWSWTRARKRPHEQSVRKHGNLARR